jgi:hypothetical protein
MDPQRMKELAHHMAAKHGLSLFTRGWDVFAVAENGTTYRICRAKGTPSEVWTKVYLILKERETPPKPYRMTTPHGIYEAPTLLGLLRRYWCGDRVVPVETP